MWFLASAGPRGFRGECRWPRHCVLLRDLTLGSPVSHICCFSSPQAIVPSVEQPRVPSVSSQEKRLLRRPCSVSPDWNWEFKNTCSLFLRFVLFCFVSICVLSCTALAHRVLERMKQASLRVPHSRKSARARSERPVQGSAAWRGLWALKVGRDNAAPACLPFGVSDELPEEKPSPRACVRPLFLSGWPGFPLGDPALEAPFRVLLRDE